MLGRDAGSLEEILEELEAALDAREAGQSWPDYLATKTKRLRYLNGLAPLFGVLGSEPATEQRWREVAKALGMNKGAFDAMLAAERKRSAEEQASAAVVKRQQEHDAYEQGLLQTSADLYRIHAGLEEVSSADHDLIEVLLASAISLAVSRQTGDALLWLLVIGNPSGDKTNQASLLADMPHVYFLDTLTENSFITGYVPEDGEPSRDLLAELDGRCLIVKELGTLFSMKAELIHKVLGDLQAVYDGHFAKFTGTRGLVKYTAAFSFIGCVTPLALNQHQRYMATIGPRFLFYRLLPLTEEQVKTGFELSWSLTERRQKLAELRRLVSAYGWQRYQAKIAFTPESETVKQRLQELAVFLSYGRAVALTEGHRERGEEGKSYVTYETSDFQREEPFRALQQLRVLARSLAVVHGRAAVADHELELLRRVVLSSMPPARAETLLLFQNPVYLRGDGGLTRRGVSEGLKKSYNPAKRLLHELERLELLESVSDSESKERVYYPAGRFKELITTPITSLDHLLDLEGGAKNFPQGQEEKLAAEPELFPLSQGEVSGKGHSQEPRT